MVKSLNDPRIAALARFAIAISVFTILGHTLFGFEPSWAHPFVGVLAAYATELLLESIEARSQRRRPRFLGEGTFGLVKFLLPAHISGLAVSMLLYANERLAPIAFAAAVAIGSKYTFRATVDGRLRHFFNPSNLGITATLLFFPEIVGLAMPYQFTENLGTIGDWALPGVIVLSGSFLNARFTHKVPLILAWVGTFAVQGLTRAIAFDTPVLAALNPMTGLAFLLFTFYMVSDPSTTPTTTRGQIAFGASVALTYGLLLTAHTVFTLFFALSIVCLGRGILLWAREQAARRSAATATVPANAVAGSTFASGAAVER
jgi:hypothetical protein